MNINLIKVIFRPAIFQEGMLRVYDYKIRIIYQEGMLRFKDYKIVLQCKLNGTTQCGLEMQQNSALISTNFLNIKFLLLMPVSLFTQYIWLPGTQVHLKRGAVK